MPGCRFCGFCSLWQLFLEGDGWLGLSSTSAEHSSLVPGWKMRTQPWTCSNPTLGLTLPGSPHCLTGRRHPAAGQLDLLVWGQYCRFRSNCTVAGGCNPEGLSPFLALSAFPVCTTCCRGVKDHVRVEPYPYVWFYRFRKMNHDWQKRWKWLHLESPKLPH